LTSLAHDYSSSSLSQSSYESPSSSSLDDDTPPLNASEERRSFVFINPIFNNGENSNPQTSQHQLPKWDVQLLKDVRLDERNKTGTRSSNRNEEIFSLVSHDFTEPSTFKEVVKHEEWKKNGRWV